MAVEGPAQDRLFLADDALGGFLIMLNLLGQFLESFGFIFSGNRSLFRRLFIALDNFVQTLFGDVVSALACSPCAISPPWLNRSAAERFRPAHAVASLVQLAFN